MSNKATKWGPSRDSFVLNCSHKILFTSHVAKLGEITGKTRVLYSESREITGKTRVLPFGLGTHTYFNSKTLLTKYIR